MAFDEINKYSIAPGSLQDAMARAQASYSPELQARLAQIAPNTPGQAVIRGAENARTEQVQEMGQSIGGLLGAASQGIAASEAGPGATPKAAQRRAGEIEAELSEHLDYLNPLKPKKTIGTNIGKHLGMGDNAGGILGLGIQPIDLLAFAAGAAVTSNLPQDKAMAMTFQIAGLPKAFRDNQEQAARKFIDDKLQVIGGDVANANLAQRRLELVAQEQERARRNSVLNLASQALSSGKPMDRATRQLLAANAHGILPPEVIKNLTHDSLEMQLEGVKQVQALSSGMPVSATLNDPNSGMQIKVGGGGGSGRPIVSGEIIDGLTTGVQTERLSEAGYDVVTPEGRVKAAAGLAKRQELERSRLTISANNSDRAERALEQPRDPEVKKLTALQELHRGASDMLGKYNAALGSHGGQFSGDLQVAIDMATRSPDTFIGKTLQALGQRHPKLTAQDLEFVSRYASMQKFARGSLNDVGNLSNYERGIFQTMVGTPLDRPEVFRSRTQTAINDAAIAYDQEYRTLGITRNLSAFTPVLGQQLPGTTPARRSGGSLQPAPQEQQGQQAERRYNPATRTFEEIKR
jgi:hypothetical protein